MLCRWLSGFRRLEKKVVPASSSIKHSYWTVCLSMMKALSLFDTSGTPHPRTQRHIQEDLNLHVMFGGYNVHVLATANECTAYKSLMTVTEGLRSYSIRLCRKIYCDA
jgi:hypothetical protein